MVKINGTLQDVTSLTIAEYLEQSNFNTARIAIELNEKFVPKTKYAEITLKDGDSLEIVSFVGGG